MNHGILSILLTDAKSRGDWDEVDRIIAEWEEGK